MIPVNLNISKKQPLEVSEGLFYLNTKEVIQLEPKEVIQVDSKKDIQVNSFHEFVKYEDSASGLNLYYALFEFFPEQSEEEKIGIMAMHQNQKPEFLASGKVAAKSEVEKKKAYLKNRLRQNFEVDGTLKKRLEATFPPTLIEQIDEVGKSGRYAFAYFSYKYNASQHKKEAQLKFGRNDISLTILHIDWHNNGFAISLEHIKNPDLDLLDDFDNTAGEGNYKEVIKTILKYYKSIP